MLLLRLFRAKNSCVYKNKFFERSCSSHQTQQLAKKKETSIPSELKEHLIEKNLAHLIDTLPLKLIKKRKYNLTTPIYVINPDTAKAVSSIISNDLLENTSYVVECNPGYGFLTKELLRIGVPHITLYERFDKFTHRDSSLIKLVAENQDRLTFKRAQYYGLWMLALHDHFNEDKLADDYLKDIPKKDWASECSCQIISFCASKYFVSMMSYNFAFQTKVFDYGRPCYYLIIPLYIWNRLTADHSDPKRVRYYSNYNIIFHLFFDHECLGEVPRKDVLPWFSHTKKSQVIEMDEPMLVIKIEPKKYPYDILEKDALQGFWFFLKHCLKSKYHKVILELEKLIPGCGPRLIKENIHICTTFKDLSPEKLLDLYKKFRLWPEYDEGLFIPNSLEHRKEDERMEQDGEQGGEESRETAIVDQ